MKLPEKIKIGGIDYEVLLVPLKSEELNYGDVIGSIIHSECKIWINKEMPLQKQQETLLHEIIHAIDVFIGDSNHEDFEENVESFGKVLSSIKR